MKNESAYAKKFTATIREVKRSTKADPPPQLDPITQIVIGFLEWNATRKEALEAHDRLMEVLVDNNDLRVSLPTELIAMIGPKYPDAELRIHRLREVLHEIYLREHDVSLDSLQGKTKKQVRNYLESLPGITPYVSAQVELLNFDVHAIPIDERTALFLKEEGAVDEEATVAEIAGFAERQIKAGEGPDVHAALRAWADRKRRVTTVTGKKKPTQTQTKKKTTRKKTTKKKTTKKKTTKKKTTKKKKTISRKR